MSDDAEKLVYLDRDRGWQLPEPRAEEDDAVSNIVDQAHRDRLARLIRGVRQERDELIARNGRCSAELRMADRDLDDAIRERDELREEAKEWEKANSRTAGENWTLRIWSDRKHDRLVKRVAERDELRALLAPLLDDPQRVGIVCCVCRAAPRCVGPMDFDEHAPTCPVLRKDALLGRET